MRCAQLTLFCSFALFAGRGTAAPGSPLRRHALDVVAEFSDESSDGVALEKRQTCALGSWQCVSQELQRCYNGQWNTFQTCSGDHIVCSAEGSLVGCVWDYSVGGGSLASSPDTAASPTVAGPTGAIRILSTDATSALSTGTGTTVSPDTTLLTAATSGPGTTAETTTTDGNGATGPVTSTVTDITSDTTTLADQTSAASSTLASSGAGDSTSTASDPSETGSAGSSAGGGDFKAPHYTIYADLTFEPDWPTAADLKPFNRLLLAFWLETTPDGTGHNVPFDNAKVWAGFDDAKKQKILDDYHSNGIALMVSCFGATDAPTTKNADATDLAGKVADFVIKNKLDGVDVDYEDPAADHGTAEKWLEAFHTELRKLLPSPMLISSAPLAPWFGPSPNYVNGMWKAMSQSIGDTIDFFAIQYYNDGAAYTDCTDIIETAKSFPETSIFEIHEKLGIPLEKLVIGKPTIGTAAPSGGFMAPEQLAECYAQATGKGWNGGLSFWQWGVKGAQPAPEILSTILGKK